jgi:5-methylcytosine-specific restriction protein A
MGVCDSSRVRVRDDDGIELDAEFAVRADGPYLSLFLESAGGRGGANGQARNHQYVPALMLLLSRLGGHRAVLLRALVASAKVAALSEEARTVLQGPVEMAMVTDVDRFRLDLTTGQGRVGLAADARKEGNNRKRLQLRLDVPGYGPEAADRLAADLASPSGTEQESAASNLVLVTIEKPALRWLYLPLADLVRSGFFPADAVGERNRKQGQGALLTVWFAGAGEPVLTDLGGEHKTFRERTTPLREFFARNHIRPGDQVAIERLGTYEYHLTRALTPDELVDRVSRLRVSHAAGRPALYQPITLLWAIGRARHGHPRLTGWDETDRSLQGLLQRHGAHGERPRPDYPIAALTRAGLWELRDHTGPTPTAHGDAELRRWFDTNRPQSGLPAGISALLRESGTTCIRVIDALLSSYFQGENGGGLLQELGLIDGLIADVPAYTGNIRSRDSTLHGDYQQLCGIAERGEADRTGKRASRMTRSPLRSAAARRAVLLRSEGRCENPGCAGQPHDLTDRGDPILEVDHVDDLAGGGHDHPRQMIALCPNCHAIKTRGRTRHQMRPALLKAAEARHNAWQCRRNDLTP